jgi:hypothetical protein
MFRQLPDELMLNIMRQLEEEYRDPVSQLCFGLTSRRFYRVFHTVRDYFIDGEGYYPIGAHPFSFNMKVSVDGQHMLFGWYEWGLQGLVTSRDIVWQRDVGDLLKDELWLWKNLCCCAQCQRYKPLNAFEGFAFEEDMRIKYHKEIAEIDRNCGLYWEQCRRCRAKLLKTKLEKRLEVFERGNVGQV